MLIVDTKAGGMQENWIRKRLSGVRFAMLHTLSPIDPRNGSGMWLQCSKHWEEFIQQTKSP